MPKKKQAVDPFEIIPPAKHGIKEKPPGEEELVLSEEELDRIPDEEEEAGENPEGDEAPAGEGP